MDDSILELENELKRLRPRSPSMRLIAHIEGRLGVMAGVKTTGRSVAATGSPLRSWLTWQKVAAAAAVVAFAGVVIATRHPYSGGADHVTRTTIAGVGSVADATWVPNADSSAHGLVLDNNRYSPVGAASVLYDLREEGASTRMTSTPVRRLRYRYVDTYTWKNPATNASLKWSLPRDEVRVLPAILH